MVAVLDRFRVVFPPGSGFRRSTRIHGAPGAGVPQGGYPQSSNLS
jgi:hypothetical protein